MTPLRLTRDVSGRRRLELWTKRLIVFAWLHPFSRPWWFPVEGMWCGGAGWISFNVLYIGAS